MRRHHAVAAPVHKGQQALHLLLDGHLVLGVGGLVGVGRLAADGVGGGRLLDGRHCGCIFCCKCFVRFR